MTRLEPKTSVAIALFACWMASYLERFLINMALPFIGEEYSLRESEMGILLSVFFVGYALVQIPAGWLADKYGSRKMILFSICFFSIMSAVTGLAWSIGSLFVIRFLFGVLEGCFAPAAFKTVAEIYPKETRGRIQSIMYATNPICLVIAPLLAVPLIGAFGWRGMFLTASLIGLAALMLQVFMGRGAHKAIHEAAGKTANAPKKSVSFKTLMRDPLIMKIALVNFGLNILIWGFLSWIPSYLLKVVKLDLASVGAVAAVPGVAGVVGILVGGWLADKVFLNKEKYLLAGSILSASVALLVMLTTHSLLFIVICQAVVAFGVKIAFIGLWTLPLRMFDAEQMGAASGIVNLGSQLAGVFSPAIMGFMIVIGGGSYSAAFIFLAVCAAVSAGIALTIGGPKPSPIRQQQSA